VTILICRVGRGRLPKGGGVAAEQAPARFAGVISIGDFPIPSDPTAGAEAGHAVDGVGRLGGRKVVPSAACSAIPPTIYSVATRPSVSPKPAGW
jgi:hypothetical protein